MVVKLYKHAVPELDGRRRRDHAASDKSRRDCNIGLRIFPGAEFDREYGAFDVFPFVAGL